MSPHIDTAWQAVCDLEGSLVKIADLMHALQLLAPSLGCGNSGAVFTIGTLAEDLCADLKRKHEVAFESLHQFRRGGDE